VDKATGRPKGTAFVDFHEPRSAAAAVAAAEKEEGGGVKLAGRRLAVALAVSASEAASLAEKRSKESLVGGRAKRDGPRDNRNLYLASEGQVHEEGPAARGVSQTDIQKRRRAKEEQAMKLKNPNFFISKTRLQVRNVPLEMDQKQLKRVFFDAVKQRATQANPRVTHAKLLFDPTRPDANGKPRSRGIGFVEFAEHEHALAALRALNNNPTTFTSQRRPIVEFAVEDARAVRKLERRREGLDKAQRERDAEREARGEAAARDEADGAKKKTRGQKRREREREGEVGAAKKPWGNKKRSLSGEGDAAASDGARGGDTKALGDGGRRGSATTPATKPATKRREPAFVPERKPPREAPKKRPREGDAAPANVAGRGLERRDATDDLVDRHVARARAGDARGAKPAKALGRWFDY
jgi:nucleolar protein 4